tara:strand:+ start:1202 stop:1423 length:222 start_codon:yes stop_codon:yes gene_type:complete
MNPAIQYLRIPHANLDPLHYPTLTIVGWAMVFHRHANVYGVPFFAICETKGEVGIGECDGHYLTDSGNGKGWA